jgi:hypothetical protein
MRAGAAIVFVCLSAALAAAADNDVSSFRVFLKDGSSLVSFGEFARVEDRVVFSMPTSTSADDPRLQLIDLSADHVDWSRTTRYADSVRSARYMATQAEFHYTLLTAEIAQAINDVQTTQEPGKRLMIVERARRTLADWPASHFNYKQAEVAQMLDMLDEAIAELRAQAGIQRFDLNFVAARETAEPEREPLLEPPTLREVIEQTLTAARLSDSSAGRVTLMSVALASIDRDSDILPSDWRTEVRRNTRAAIAMELETDRAYQSLSSRMLSLANQRARAANVRGIERLVEEIRARDRELGGRRPDAVIGLLTAVEAELDAARRLRLERDKWAIRAPELRGYRDSVAPSLERLGQIKQMLEDIKALAGSGPWALGNVERAARQVLERVSNLKPPEELAGAHAMLVSAAQMADNAAKIRREAALTGSIARAWDASAAAAGSMMLSDRARTEIRDLLRRPELQ